MKALSIIGIIISSLGIIYGLMTATDHKDGGVVSFSGVLMLIGSIYFLAFSVVAIVVAAKNKKG